MFQEIVDSPRLETMEEPEELQVSLPRNVVTQVKLQGEDLVEPELLYRSMWNIFAIDPTWYCQEGSRQSVANIIPSFLILKFRDCPFWGGFFQSHETYQFIKDLMENNLILMPIINVKKSGNAKFLKFLGIKQNLSSTYTNGFHMRYSTIMVVDRCLMGEFYNNLSRAKSFIYAAEGKVTQYREHIDRMEDFLNYLTEEEEVNESV